MTNWPPDAPPAGEDSPAGAPMDHLMPLVYEELKSLAEKLLSSRSAQVTLQPTSLVHEAYLRLLDQRRMDWQDRAHFFRIAAKVMRRVLVDHCRTRSALKRGGAQVALELEEALAIVAPQAFDVLMVDHLLADLEAVDPQQARVVELRFFAGLTLEETSQALEISTATVKREWTVAKAWLTVRMGRSPAGDGR